MHETHAEILKKALVQKGVQKGAIKNPLTAQEESNTILELIGRASPDGYIIDRKAKQALDKHSIDYVLTSQAEKTVQAEKKSLKDPLTGVLNRDGLLQEMKLAMTEIDRKGGAVHVVFMDLNHFKVFNDTWGHSVGDKALIALVESMQRYVRPYDRIGRWGGEEFVLLIKNGNADIVQLFADRMHNALRELEPPFNEIKADIGLADYVSNSEKITPADIIHRADQAMYFAKKNKLTTVNPWNPSMESIVVPK